MVVVTASNKEHFEIIHGSSGLLKYFIFVLTGADYKRFKPHPEPYLLAVKKGKCNNNECIAIEDSESELTSAKGAGIRCYIVLNELTKGSNIAFTDKVLYDIKN